MSMGPGDSSEIRIPLRISTDQLASDLASVDREITRLQERMVSAFNRSTAVRRGRATRAESVQDIGAQREYWTPEVKALERRLNARLQQIERAAQRGETRPPLTPFQVHQQAARERLSAAGRPIEITAKQKFFDDMRTSLLRGLGSAPAMAAAQTGIPGASSVARTLMGLLADNPALAAGLGGAAALGGGALAINALQSSFQRQQAALAGALVGGPAFGQTRTLLGLGVMAAAQSQDVAQDQGAALAQQLAGAGMRPGQVLRNMPNVLGMTQRYGQQMGDVEPLVAALGTAGGMNANQIKQTLSDIVDASGNATGSIQQLTQGLRALSAVNAAAGRDAFGLAAIQRAVGPTSGINAGQLMAPAMGATGASALQAAAFLGMSPQEFLRDQATKGGMARIYDRIAASSRIFGSDATGTLIAEQVLGPGGMNLLGTQGLSATQQAAQIRRMQRARPGAAHADYLRRAHAPRPHRPLPPTNVSAVERLRILAQNTLTGAVATHGLGDLASRALAAVGTGNFAPLLDALHPLPQVPMHFIPPDQLAQRLRREQAASDATHTVKIDVTVRDQRGRELGHAVDHTRVVAGARTALRPPHERAGALDTPSAQQLPGRWNEGSWS